MRRLLVANRGEIARRVIRTAHAMGLRTVAVFTDPDSRARHVQEADAAMRVPSYLDVDALLRVAAETQADAVHPGYGFVSERAPAAKAITDAGLTWVGPPPGVIEALGDKINAKALMAKAGLPTLEAGDDTFPVLVKAAAGGGGRGMRVVTVPGDLTSVMAAASREAEAAFGDGTVFLERWLPDPRHVEVQIVADGHGTVVHLGERECSIQRRHQKVVEESPSPGISAGLRARMTDAAVAGARAVGYVNAGTWEFLVDGDDFFFLEVNTRLQVEHPVTEAVTGLDLVRLQLQIADGEPLGLTQADVSTSGHAIEVRVVAEDPGQGWLPSTGTLHRFRATDANARADLGFGDGDVVSPDYDSLLGKIIGHGATRAEAARITRRGVDGLQIHGLATNRALLSALLDEPDFLAGATTTGYLERHPDLEASQGGRDQAAVAAALWQQAERRRTSTFPSGWRNLRSQPQRVAYLWHGETVTVEYVVGGAASVDGRPFTGQIDGLECEQRGDSIWVGSPTAQHVFVELPRFPDPTAAQAHGQGPTAPVPGTVIAVEVAPGDVVTAGQTLVVLEAMKLEHRIRAESDGVVAAVKVIIGEKVDAHQLLVVFE